MASSTATASSYTVASYLVARLAELGLKHVFAVPGDYMAAFCTAVDNSGVLTRIGTCSEMEAGQAADAYARINGMGAVAVTYGVGSFSALNAVAGSYVERLPVVLINGSPNEVGRAWWHKDQVLFHHSTGDFRADFNAYRDVTVAGEIVADPDNAPAQIDHALTEAITWRSPVYIEVLSSVWTQACAAPEGKLAPRPFQSTPSALEAAVRDTLDVIERAGAETLLWGGVELARMGLADTFEALVAGSGLAYVTDILGKSLLAETTPGFVGVYAGVASADPAVIDRVNGSPAIIMLGPVLTDDYLDIIAQKRGDIVTALETSVRVGWREYPDVGLVDFITELARRCPKVGRGTAAVRPTSAPALSDADAVTYAGLVQAVSDVLDDQMVVLADTSGVIYPATGLTIKARNGYISQAAWLSIGYTAAAALGAALASGKRPIALVGDGGFHMTATAVATLAREKTPAILIVIDNGMYGIEQALVNPDFYVGSPPPAPTDYCVLPVWDYVKFAEALGAKGFRAENLGQLKGALNEALAVDDQPALISVAMPLRQMSSEVLALAQDPIVPPPQMVRSNDHPRAAEATKRLLAGQKGADGGLRGLHRP